MDRPTSGRPPWPARLIMLVFRTLMVAAVGLVAVVVITAVWWRLTPTRDLDVLVYDQTVPDDRYPAHAVLAQLFEYHRIPFELGQDHVGAAPGGEPHGVWPAGQPDLVFLADTYGVYLDAGGRVDEFGGQLASGTLTVDQADDIATWVEAGTPAYAEFALLPEPTPAEVGERLEDVFGYRATGWFGRSVEDLGALSPGLRSLGPSPWPYEGPGLVFVSLDVAGRPALPQLVVLTERELSARHPDVVGGPPGSFRGRAPFDAWFAIVLPVEGASVDAVFELPANAAGVEVLDRAGIPPRFPALIRGENTMYFAGDGLSDETPFRLRRLKGGAVFTRLVTGDEFRFVYQILEPTVAWMIDRAEQNRLQIELNRARTATAG